MHKKVLAGYLSHILICVGTVLLVGSLRIAFDDMVRAETASDFFAPLLSFALELTVLGVMVMVWTTLAMVHIETAFEKYGWRDEESGLHQTLTTALGSRWCNVLTVIVAIFVIITVTLISFIVGVI